jgi:hypothetical protein
MLEQAIQTETGEIGPQIDFVPEIELFVGPCLSIPDRQ